MSDTENNAATPLPKRYALPDDDSRTKLVGNVREALVALSFHFESKTVIAGLEVLDLFSLNSVLGGTIEVQTVATLNRIRDVWDPDDEWSNYGFERSSQSFPDVRLVNRTGGSSEPALGIELKGWYLLAKEKAPSFRYTATRDACSIFDLLVVVPWHLSDVLSGPPVVRDPYIEQAKYAADFRNYYWQHQRGPRVNGDIDSPKGVQPYPPPKTLASDKPKEDKGGNFGRVARVQGLMDAYIDTALTIPISGIEAGFWIEFFKVFADASDSNQIHDKMQQFLKRHRSDVNERIAEQVVEHLVEIQQLLGTAGVDLPI